MVIQGYTEFVDALERAEEECRQCGIAAAMAAGTTLGQSALQAGPEGEMLQVTRMKTWPSRRTQVLSLTGNSRHF